MTSGAPSRVAVVTVVHGRRDHLASQRAGLSRSSVRPLVHVVVRIDDDNEPAPLDSVPTCVVDIDADPLGLPLAAARNRGAAEALDLGATLLVFLDVDCIPADDLVARYVGAAEHTADRLLCGPVTYLPPAGDAGYDLDRLAERVDPHPARPSPPDGELQHDDRHELFWSLSFAVTAPTWDRIGGFDESYVGYGGEDTDVGQRARAAGVGLTWVGGAHAFHQHHPVSSPPVEHLDDILRNGRLFADRWGWWPMQGWLEQFQERGMVESTPEGWQRLGE